MKSSQCGVRRRIDFCYFMEDFTMQDSNDKVYGVLAYIGILFLVPLLAGKSEFSRYHANQGLVLFIADIILGIVGAILGGILSGVLGLCIFILMIMGIVHAANGEMKPLPIIGGITIIK